MRSSSCFSCCFRGASGGPLPHGGEGPALLLRSSSAWIRSKAQELPELKERCKAFVSRFSRPRRNFGYDPLDYALNFDDGEDEEPLAAAEFPYRSFASRFPASQPPATST